MDALYKLALPETSGVFRLAREGREEKLYPVLGKDYVADISGVLAI